MGARSTVAPWKLHATHDEHQHAPCSSCVYLMRGPPVRMLAFLCVILVEGALGTIPIKLDQTLEQLALELDKNNMSYTWDLVFPNGSTVTAHEQRRALGGELQETSTTPTQLKKYCYMCRCIVPKPSCLSSCQDRYGCSATAEMRNDPANAVEVAHQGCALHMSVPEP